MGFIEDESAGSITDQNADGVTLSDGSATYVSTATASNAETGTDSITVILSTETPTSDSISIKGNRMKGVRLIFGFIILSLILINRRRRIR